MKMYASGAVSQSCFRVTPDEYQCTWAACFVLLFFLSEIFVTFLRIKPFSFLIVISLTIALQIFKVNFYSWGFLCKKMFRKFRKMIDKLTQTFVIDVESDLILLSSHPPLLHLHVSFSKQKKKEIFVVFTVSIWCVRASHRNFSDCWWMKKGKKEEVMREEKTAFV